jgi:hypothetical protein
MGLKIIFLLVGFYTTVLLADPKDGVASQTNVGLRLDCVQDFSIDKGDTQSCLTVSGLRLAHKQQVNDHLSGRLSLNPFAGVDSVSDSSPMRSGYPSVGERQLQFMEDYGVIWSPRANLEIGLEKYRDAAGLLNISQLAFGSSLSASGWDQTAFTITYRLPAAEKMNVKFVFGNGEGENGVNTDPQQYFGFEFGSEVVLGVETKLGFSFDGNSAGSAESLWRAKGFSECGLALDPSTITTGYSTKRMGLGVMLNGKLPAARGLLMALGWQRVTKNDLSKSKQSEPSIAELADCPSLEPDKIFLEDPTGATVNSVVHTTVGLNSAYRILDTYFLAFDVESRKIDTGIVKFFEPCEDFVGESCEGRKTPQSHLTQASLTVGFGMDVEPDLRLALEYNRTNYDQPYNKFHYAGRDGELSKTAEIVNARLSYNWR